MANKLGRLRKPAVSILVDVDGELVAYTNGHISASKNTVKQIRINSQLKIPVNITYAGPEIVSDLESQPVNVLAAIMSVYPERSRILEAPAEILNMLPFENDEDIY